MPSRLINIQNLSVKINNSVLLKNNHLDINENKQWAVIGASGSGKTTLAHVLTGKIFYTGIVEKNFSASEVHKAIVLVEQQHHFKNLSNTSDFYYQQRFHSFDAEDSITVQQLLQSFPGAEKWLDILHLPPLLLKPLIQLSNGENKRLQMAKALAAHPSLLILDNPFTGLDKEGRQTLHAVLNKITHTGIHLLLIAPLYELPSCITHIAVLENGELIYQGKKETYHPGLNKKAAENPIDIAAVKNIKVQQAENFEEAVRMVDVNVQYGGKKILEHINWIINKGECWNLSGPNGAGKSTLLSLIYADNPQAYANEIYLFDKKRGSGESIWDIKKQIGYVSPELHLFFEKHITCFEVIASGLFDTIGLFRKLNTEQEKTVWQWIQALQLEKFSDKHIFRLSVSQQKMVLLARALIKNPPLLILDEPCQGLDEEQTAYFISLVNQLCIEFGTTLIYVSHYAKDIPLCVTHYLKLEEGKIAE